MRIGVVDCDPYHKYSVRYHLESLPPVCLLHGIDDELSPFSQSVQLAEELARRGHPHVFHTYEGLKHCFFTSADDATTQQVFQDSLDCLRISLARLRGSVHKKQLCAKPTPFPIPSSPSSVPSV